MDAVGILVAVLLPLASLYVWNRIIRRGEQVSAERSHITWEVDLKARM